MTLSAEQIAPHTARFLDTLDAAFRDYGVPEGLPLRFREAVASTPRHRFVHRFRIGDGPLRDNDQDPIQNLPDIYSDAVMRHVDATGKLLPSSNSQPSYVLFLLHLLGLEQKQTVLEIGSGSGWLAAIMARLVGPHGRVTGIELIPDLAAQSRTDLQALGLDNVEIITGDGTRGHAAGAPYDRAIITAATWDVPAVLLDHMREGGRVLIPIELSSGDGCDVTLLRKHASMFASERSVRGWFVPLQGDSQGRRDMARASPPISEPIARHALPLGVFGNSGPASTATLFRAFLGRTEPGFVAAVSGADGRWRPGLPVPLLGTAELPAFGIAEADGSTALWQAGEITSYGGRKAATRLAQAYARWAALGLPGMEAFQLEVHRKETAPAATDSLSVEARGTTVLAWRLKPSEGSWHDLTGADEHGAGPEDQN